jgi:hypothetical protein
MTVDCGVVSRTPCWVEVAEVQIPASSGVARLPSIEFVAEFVGFDNAIFQRHGRDSGSGCHLLLLGASFL